MDEYADNFGTDSHSKIWDKHAEWLVEAQMPYIATNLLNISL